MDFYEIYHLLIQEKNFPGIQVVEKIEFETQKTAAEVNFNYRKVMEYEDDPNIEVLGFYHTHPNGHTRMSSTDIETMKAWTTCFGRSLLCLIGTKIHHYQDYYEEVVNGWRCFQKGCFPVAVYPFICNEKNYQIYKGPKVRAKNLLDLSRYFIKG